MEKKVLGLILELNPFHTGHKYFIEKAINDVKPDITVALITSSFSMRADVAVIDKFKKAELLSTLNVDLVLELPFLYANNSSDYFALSAISILNEAKITHLAFGSEIEKIEDLYKIYNITKTIEYNNLLKSFLSKGLSYQTSALKAFMAISLDKDLISNYRLPNNTLAISYLDAIKKVNNNIKPYSIKRIGNMYYDKEVNGTFASASALREKINKDEDIKDYIFYDYDFLKEKDVNEKIYSIFKYCLITKDIKNICNVKEGIENRLVKFIDKKTYEEYVSNVSTKRYPENRIKRLMMDVIFNVSKKYEDLETFLPYLRVLYASKKGLSHLKGLNIITNINDNIKPEIKEILDKELEVTKIYDFLTGKDIFKKEFMFGVKK